MTTTQTLTDELAYAAEVGAEIAERYRLLSGRVDVLSDDERETVAQALDMYFRYAIDSGAMEDPDPSSLYPRFSDPRTVVVVMTRTEDGDE